MKNLVKLFLVLIVVGVICFISVKKFKDTKQEGPNQENAETISEEEPDKEKELSQKLDNIISSMTMEDKIYQMLMVQQDSYNWNDFVDTKVGGIIIGNKSSYDNLEVIGSDYKIKPFIATDDEGGTVERAVKGYKGARNYNCNLDEIYNDETSKCKKLLEKNINLNLGPVTDAIDLKNSALYTRSFSGEYDKVKECVNTIIQARNNTIVNGKSIGVCLKHYPGYPENSNNTDFGKTIDNTSVDEINKKIDVFINGINSGADCVMVSNVIYNNLDNENSASLSKNIITNLRSNFNGIIMTDDIGVAKSVANIQERYKMAIIAGNDMILIWKAQQDIAYKQILEAVKNNEIEEEQINDSVKRILKVKNKLGIIDVYKQRKETKE